jgi:hypothetical protein
VRTGILGRGGAAIWGCGFLLLMVGSLDVSAGSSSPNPRKIGRDLLVGVFNQGRPVAGLQIERSTDPRSGDQESRAISIVTTDADGLARFASVPPGPYFRGIKHPAYAYSEELQVMRHPPKGSQEKVTFEWPGGTPLTTQSVSGSLNGHVGTERGLGRDLSPPIYGPVQGAKLTLAKGVTNEIVDAQATQESGRFTFAAVAAGFCFLRVDTPVSNNVRWHSPIQGYVPIVVDPSAKFLSLNLFLDDGSVANSRGNNAQENDPINA